MKYISYLICLLFWTGSLTAGIRKSDIKVLYVGGSADTEEIPGRTTPAMTAESIRQRTASFEKMLKRYFRNVTVIHAKDYRAAFSDNYDVTVMDGTPEPILPEIRETDKDGRPVRYEKAGYLPENFSRPMVMIADMSETMGRRIGLKTDWYCRCLDADAHHIRTEHPIFKGPFPVKLTMVKKPTPEVILTLPYIDGGMAPDSLPMWRVQKEGYQSKPGTRIGMVSRPGGFEDSPEAEFISGGVSAKTWDAVAIGRHGNFLHWGFAGSPDNMTAEAQNVFANAIVYIAGFAGQTPIARKYNDRITTRHDISLRAFFTTRFSYELNKEAAARQAAKIEDIQRKAKEKQAAGKDLSEMEKMAMNYRPQPIGTYEEQLQEHFPVLYRQFGTDEEAYADYFHDNAPYIYPQDYDFIIDEDVRSLGIPNNDIRLLDKAISLWESGERVGKARRILTRYTLCRFTTPQEWRAWFETNKSRLFFTEAGGWVFLVNTRDKSIPGNDYSVLNAPVKPTVSAPASSGTAVTDDRNPVCVTVSAEKLPNGNRMLTVRINIHKGYHIYARVADSDPFIATTVAFRFGNGMTPVGDLQRPAGKNYNSAGTIVYENEVFFRQEVSGSGEATCVVGWQCCNETICMPPVEKEFKVKIE